MIKQDHSYQKCESNAWDPELNKYLRKLLEMSIYLQVSAFKEGDGFPVKIGCLRIT